MIELSGPCWAYGGIREPGSFTTGGAGSAALIGICTLFGLTIGRGNQLGDIQIESLPLVNEQRRAENEQGWEYVEVNENSIVFLRKNVGWLRHQ
jgi:hypothetical protein